MKSELRMGPFNPENCFYISHDIFDLDLIPSIRLRTMFFFLCSRMDNEGHVSVSNKDIARYCKIGRKKVPKILEKLQASNMLQIEKRTNEDGRTTSLYIINSDYGRRTSEEED